MMMLFTYFFTYLLTNLSIYSHKNLFIGSVHDGMPSIVRRNLTCSVSLLATVSESDPDAGTLMFSASGRGLQTEG